MSDKHGHERLFNTNHQDWQLELDALWNQQPVKLPQDWHNVVRSVHFIDLYQKPEVGIIMPSLVSEARVIQ